MIIRLILLITFLVCATFLINSQHQSKVSAQFIPCPSASPRADGLVSAHTALQGLSNPWQQCATGGKVAFAPFDITNFKGLLDTFYIGTNSSAKVIPPPAPPAPGTPYYQTVFSPIPATNKIIYLEGDLVIDSSHPAISGTGTAVVFVNGKLDIQTDITYSDSCVTCGLIFVVSGPINIYGIVPGVNKIDAILISSGDKTGNDYQGVAYSASNYTICTYYEPGSAPFYCPSVKINTPLADTERLSVHGSLISLNSTKNINFRRDINDNDLFPSEEVIAQPKYFALLKDLFTKPGSVTTVNTRFAMQ